MLVVAIAHSSRVAREISFLVAGVAISSSEQEDDFLVACAAGIYLSDEMMITQMCGIPVIAQVTVAGNVFKNEKKNDTRKKRDTQSHGV